MLKLVKYFSVCDVVTRLYTLILCYTVGSGKLLKSGKCLAVIVGPFSVLTLSSNVLIVFLVQYQYSTSLNILEDPDVGSVDLLS